MDKGSGPCGQENELLDIEMGRRLAVLRLRCGMSQQEAARALGTTQSNISQLEHGKRRISLAAAVRLAEIYHTDLSSFMYNETAASLPDGTGGELIARMLSGEGITDMRQTVRIYFALCEYRMLRALCDLDPAIPEDLFTMPAVEAYELTEEFLCDEPFRLRLLLPDKDLCAGLIPDDLTQLREFAAACEKLLRSLKQ
ncbi:MAG: helix-turn-helix transcriptional regulator [Ruminococcus sp.]|nr:helix-turn-helix transcriptional regulator [Ruminococcus sp.]